MAIQVPATEQPRCRTCRGEMILCIFEEDAEVEGYWRCINDECPAPCLGIGEWLKEASPVMQEVFKYWDVPFYERFQIAKGVNTAKLEKYIPYSST